MGFDFAGGLSDGDCGCRGASALTLDVIDALSPGCGGLDRRADDRSSSPARSMRRIARLWVRLAGSGGSRLYG